MNVRKTMGWLRYLGLTAVLLWSLGSQPATAQDLEELPLIGACSRDSLEMNWPDFQPSFSDLSPAALNVLQTWADSIHIYVFLGTWCSDSKREVPRFFEIIDAIQNPVFTYTLYGLNRDKQDERGLVERFGIERVPTFIFLKGDLELGRIVETPQRSLEEDWARLLRHFQRMKLPEPVDAVLLPLLIRLAARW